MMDAKINNTIEKITKILQSIKVPFTNNDIVTAGMVDALTINGDHLTMVLHLGTPAYPHRDELYQAVVATIKEIPGIESFHVELDTAVIDDGFQRSSMQGHVKNVIAVASGKGGVGKSTIAVNVAVVLAGYGTRVGLLDADIYGPNLPTMMGITGLPDTKNGKMIPVESHGVKLISIGMLVDPRQALIWRGPMLHSAIRQFIEDVIWGDLDYLIVDLPPGTGDAQLSLSQTIPLTGGVIVTLPQIVSIEDARRGIKMFQQLDVPIIGVVENMSYLVLENGSNMDIFGSGGGQALSSEFGVPFIGSLPIDPAVRIGGDNGKPVVLEVPESDIAVGFNQITENIAGWVSLASMKRSRKIFPIQFIE